MKILSNNISSHNIEPRDKNNYYLLAMLFTVVILFVFAYYDKIVASLIGI